MVVADVKEMPKIIKEKKGRYQKRRKRVIEKYQLKEREKHRRVKLIPNQGTKKNFKER